MRDEQTNEPASRFMFTLLLVCAALMLVFPMGCGYLEARRTYEYRTVTHPDGSVDKYIKADILNSDTSLGTLKATGADGTTLEINDMTAEERVSAANQTLAEGVNKAIDKIPSVPALPQ